MHICWCCLNRWSRLRISDRLQCLIVKYNIVSEKIVQIYQWKHTSFMTTYWLLQLRQHFHWCLCPNYHRCSWDRRVDCWGWYERWCTWGIWWIPSHSLWERVNSCRHSLYWWSRWYHPRDINRALKNWRGWPKRCAVWSKSLRICI